MYTLCVSSHELYELTNFTNQRVDITHYTLPMIKYLPFRQFNNLSICQNDDLFLQNVIQNGQIGRFGLVALHLMKINVSLRV